MVRDVTLPADGVIVDDTLNYRNAAEILITSQAVYQQGETLTISLPWFADATLSSVSTNECVLYYFALAYPDGRIEVIEDVNTLVPLEVIAPWSGRDGINILEKSTTGMPLGQYTVYLLRTSGYASDPIAQINLGSDKFELTATQFEIR